MGQPSHQLVQHEHMILTTLARQHATHGAVVDVAAIVEAELTIVVHQKVAVIGEARWNRRRPEPIVLEISRRTLIALIAKVETVRMIFAPGSFVRERAGKA